MTHDIEDDLVRDGERWRSAIQVREIPTHLPDPPRARHRVVILLSAAAVMLCLVAVTVVVELSRRKADRATTTAGSCRGTVATVRPVGERTEAVRLYVDPRTDGSAVVCIQRGRQTAQLPVRRSGPAVQARALLFDGSPNRQILPEVWVIGSVSEAINLLPAPSDRESSDPYFSGITELRQIAHWRVFAEPVRSSTGNVVISGTAANDSLTLPIETVPFH